MAVLLAYNLTSDFNPSTTATGVTGSTVTNASLSTFARETIGYATQPMCIVDPPTGATTVATAVTGNSYFFITIAPTSGNTLNLTSLTIDMARGDADIAEGYAIRSSVDSYAANLSSGDLATQRTTFTNISVDLTGASFQGLTTTTVFRFYIYAPTFEHTVDWDNLTINGTVSSGGTVEQEGFRFYNDNAGETAAAALAAQDTNIIREKTTNTRLRVLLNSTLNRGSETYQLEFRKVGDASWTVITT